MHSDHHNHELLFQIESQSYKSYKLPLKYITLQNQRKRRIDNYIIQDEIRQLEQYLSNQQKEMHIIKKQIKHHESYLNNNESCSSNLNINSNSSNTLDNVDFPSFNNYFDQNDSLLINNQQLNGSESNLVSNHRGRKKREEEDKSFGLFKKIQKSKMNIKSQIVFCFGLHNYLKYENDRWIKTDDMMEVVDHESPQKQYEQSPPQSVQSVNKTRNQIIIKPKLD